MARMASRPRFARVFYRGLPYRIDLVACRQALVRCQVDGELDSMERLAERVGISRSTASRFFSGRPTSLAVTLDILKALHLSFDEVATREDDPDEFEGEADAGARPGPSPSGPPPNSSLRLRAGFAG